MSEPGHGTRVPSLQLLTVRWAFHSFPQVMLLIAAQSASTLSTSTNSSAHNMAALKHLPTACLLLALLLATACASQLPEQGGTGAMHPTRKLLQVGSQLQVAVEPTVWECLCKRVTGLVKGHQASSDCVGPGWPDMAHTAPCPTTVPASCRQCQPTAAALVTNGPPARSTAAWKRAASRSNAPTMPTLAMRSASCRGHSPCRWVRHRWRPAAVQCCHFMLHR